MGIYASFNHPSITFLLLSYYLNPVVNPMAFFLFHRLRLQRSQPSVFSGTLLRSSGESRHVHPSTMREEMKLNDDKSAISDYGAEVETVFCYTGKILITNANNESTVIEANGIEDEKMNIENESIDQCEVKIN
ncbi:hypothetical protein DPMN_022794 [Dreissena polymorpha]|uniref:Uncharacterized protein n=2 Tax=Dreissena polymorpha TaxID=45954 RepID=A0A9D4SBY7_DREPO|nr:hypothetical protein DPMN_022794 [Dreissena polymorpha]